MKFEDLKELGSESAVKVCVHGKAVDPLFFLSLFSTGEGVFLNDLPYLLVFSM